MGSEPDRQHSAETEKSVLGRNQLAHLNQDQLLLRIDQKLGGAKPAQP